MVLRKIYTCLWLQVNPIRITAARQSTHISDLPKILRGYHQGSKVSPVSWTSWALLRLRKYERGKYTSRRWPKWTTTWGQIASVNFCRLITWIIYTKTLMTKADRSTPIYCKCTRTSRLGKWFPQSKKEMGYLPPLRSRRQTSPWVRQRSSCKRKLRQIEQITKRRLASTKWLWVKHRQLGESVATSHKDLKAIPKHRLQSSRTRAVSMVWGLGTMLRCYLLRANSRDTLDWMHSARSGTRLRSSRWRTQAWVLMIRQ